jgi:hypothetical protein
MKYLTVWNLPPGAISTPPMARFSGNRWCATPKGVKLLGRWHGMSGQGVAITESEDPEGHVRVARAMVGPDGDDSHTLPGRRRRRRGIGGDGKTLRQATAQGRPAPALVSSHGGGARIGKSSRVEWITGPKFRRPVFFVAQRRETTGARSWKSSTTTTSCCCRASAAWTAAASATPSVQFGGRRFQLPVVPANMKTVIDESISEWLAANGYFYVMHRFDLDNVAYARACATRACTCRSARASRKPTSHVIDRWRPRAWVPTTSPSTSPTAMPTACA